MDTFRDLEKRYDRTIVGVPDIPSISGTIKLAGMKSTVELSDLITSRREQVDENGWFDLHLEAVNEADILLKNAFEIGWRFHGKHQTRTAPTIYANVIVFNAHKLSKQQKVHSISFRISKFEYFFWYSYIESMSLYKAGASKLAAVRRLRGKRRDFRKPHSLYLAHAFKKLIKFRANDALYEITAGSSTRGGNGNRLSIKTLITARITFDTPHSIDDAINNVWMWRRFFVEVAMEPLPVVGASCRGRRKSSPEASIYLPSAARRKRKRANRNFHPGDAPYNRWNERGRLSKAMQQWVSISVVRRGFRASIERVIENLEKRTSLDDLLTLCAGLESLPELDLQNPISHQDIDALADGAEQAARATSIKISRDRIKGLLASLQHQGLPNRLKQLMTHLDGYLTKTEQRLLISHVIRLRNMAAHGRTITDEIIPRVRPVIEAMASICALFDLISCGVPGETHDRPINALAKAKHAILELR